jgi:hypothetical protein
MLTAFVHVLGHGCSPLYSHGCCSRLISAHARYCSVFLALLLETGYIDGIFSLARKIMDDGS